MHPTSPIWFKIDAFLTFYTCVNNRFFKSKTEAAKNDDWSKISYQLLDHDINNLKHWILNDMVQSILRFKNTPGDDKNTSLTI